MSVPARSAAVRNRAIWSARRSAGGARRGDIVGPALVLASEGAGFITGGARG